MNVSLTNEGPVTFIFDTKDPFSGGSKPSNTSPQNDAKEARRKEIEARLKQNESRGQATQQVLAQEA